MRFVVGTILFVLFIAAAATTGAWGGFNELLGRPPTAAEVLFSTHQFDLFEQAAAQTADQRGAAPLRRFSELASAAAERRDDRLTSLSGRANIKVKFAEEPDMLVGDRLAGLQGTVGEPYVRGYYEDQVTEHESLISLLQRYLAKPDNEDVKAFSANLVPVLRTELAATKAALDKSDKLVR